MLDGILGNQTDLPVTEHATDIHGATLANFVLFDLLGLQLSPRIRDLGKITLYRTGPRADFAARYPAAGKLLTRRLNGELITDMWERPAAGRPGRRLRQGRARHGRPGGRQAVLVSPAAERPRIRDQGVARRRPGV